MSDRLHVVPTLDDLERDPSRAETLPRDLLKDLARRSARLAADLQTLLLGSGAADQQAQSAPEIVLLPEAAKILATSEDTLYSKWQKLAFAFKDPLDGKIKFRRSGIERYIASRTGRVAG